MIPILEMGFYFGGPEGTIYSVPSGLPAGILLTETSGVLESAPDVGSSASSPYTTTVRLTDLVGRYIEQSFTWTVTAPGVSVDPTASGLAAGYDFADEDDDWANHNNTETGVPTYGSGAASTLASGAYLSPETLDSVWGDTIGNDSSFAVRLRFNGVVNTGEEYFGSAGGEVFIRPNVSDIEVSIMSRSVNVPVTPVADTWYTIVCSYGQAASTVTAWVDGADETSSTGSVTGLGGDLFFGSDGTTHQDASFDWAMFWNNRELVEGHAIYLAAGSRAVSDWYIAPTLNGTIATQNDLEGDSPTWDASTAFIDGAPAGAYALISGPGGVGINSFSGVLVGTIAAGQAASSPFSSSITLTSHAGVATQPFTWNVSTSFALIDSIDTIIDGTDVIIAP